MEAPRYSIVLPCYNERRRLPGTLETVVAHRAARGWDAEIVVVDDGSTDGTGDWAREQSRRIPALRVEAYGGNRGKGYAVRHGMLAARGACRLFMDADGATPISAADAFWPVLEDGRADLVIGSRRAAGAVVAAAQPWGRRLASAAFSALTGRLVLRGIEDTQCGFKAMTAGAAKNLFSSFENSSAIFDVELLLLAVRAGYRIVEMPVRWSHDGDSRLTYDARRSAKIFLHLLDLRRRQRVFRPVRAHPLRGSPAGAPP